MDGLRGMTLLFLYIGGPFIYLAIAGLISELYKGFFYTDSDRYVAGALWPVTLICWIVYQTATAGPRFIRWYRSPKLPKAKVIK
jgi:hypothetical protein